MVDQEVVDILAEIKQRVVSAKSMEPLTEAPTNGSPSITQKRSQTSNQDYASLAVLARAWDRLPPLVTNRTGAAAKFDLWLKAKARTALRWLTWEQINFNAATHQTFKELIEALAAQQEVISLQQQQLASIQETVRELHQRLGDEVDALDHRVTSYREQNENIRAALAAQETHLGSMRALLANQHADVNARLENAASQHSAELDQVRKIIESTNSDNESRSADVVRELRESHEHILDEHRVLFKQLSLELSEAQVLQDRARRELDTRVSRLESQK